MALCQKKGCIREATQLVKLCVPAAGDSDGPVAAEGTLALELCQAHLEDADPAAFLASEEACAMLTAMARPGVRCDFDNAYITGIPIYSGAAEQFREMLDTPKAN